MNTDRCRHELGNTAANTRDNGPENVGGVARILDSGTEADDGQSTDHTKGQCNVIANDRHDRSRKHRKRNEVDVELLRIDSSRMGDPVRKENGQSDDGSDHHAQSHVFQANYRRTALE